jgi:hypothetical protein
MARRRPAEPTANPARGAVLVVVAVVLGLFLLRNGLDTSEAVSTDPDEQRSDSSGDGGDEGSDEGSDGTTSSTAPEARAPSEVPTVVLNDSGVSGTAKKYSDALAAAGYQLTNPDGANADAEGDGAVTLIYYVAGFEAEAAAVRQAIGAPDTVVPELLPATPPGPIAGASVVVVIGLDLANVNPPAAEGGATTTTAAAAN